jgi:cardiolipin synthase
VPRLLALLASLWLTACFGRSPHQEFRLDRAAAAPQDFDNALFQTVGVELRPGNRVERVDNGRVFDAAIEAIGRARGSIHVVTFIWKDGRVSDRILGAIAARTRDGVACRVLADALGSPRFSEVETKLQGIGCETHHFRPVPGQDNAAREHRKMFVIDGRVGITGGFGIDDRWEGDGHSDDPPQWRDSNVLVRGPGVLDMQQAFAESWEEATGTLLPRDAFPTPEPEGSSAAAFVSSSENSVATKSDRLMQLLIGSARQRLWISNAYFVPSAPILELLTRKAHEGVDVRVLAAGDRTDTKAYLPEQRARMLRLVEEGVKAYEYAPTMLHSKLVVVDDAITAVGSTNLDALSLNKLNEGTLVVVDEDFARGEARQFLDDLALAREVVPSGKRVSTK